MTCKLIEAAGDVWKDLRGKMEIPLRADKACMSHIGRQEREFGTEVCTLSVPAF